MTIVEAGAGVEVGAQDETEAAAEAEAEAEAQVVIVQRGQTTDKDSMTETGPALTTEALTESTTQSTVADSHLGEYVLVNVCSSRRGYRTFKWQEPCVSASSHFSFLRMTRMENHSLRSCCRACLPAARKKMYAFDIFVRLKLHGEVVTDRTHLYRFEPSFWSREILD